ncbi:type 1 glutamine amidotransferase domain-containing protein [Nakamurella lactea]|uniref:type 1 glutamine amidotransferase domain-containing protein n=1 Tax=Nakamurella lactea TaxID=459515 RepID=UPI00040C1570|nr:type 1 glutamine amidotransferase domain-containing protein [Nakamurella lactea]
MSQSLNSIKVAVLAEDLYEDVELWYPLYRLREEGAEVIIVGSGRASTFKGKHGLPVTADVDIDAVSSYDFDGVLIPGGFSPDYMRRAPKMIDFVREAGESGKPVAAICHGPWVLASAGLCKGRKIACYFSIADDIRGAGGEFTDEAVVVDGNIITSRIPDDLPAFMPPFIEALAARKI